MEIFKIKDFIEINNPNPGTTFRKEILTNEQKAENLGGLFIALNPGAQVPYHYHEKRESIIIAISGKATAIIEGKEVDIQAGEVLYIPAREKHMVINRTDHEFRSLEFFTYPPAPADFINVE